MAMADAHNPAFDAVGNRPRRQQPRPTKAASWAIANHAKSYLEAEEYTKAYGLLYSLLAAGTSISVPAKPYVGLLAPAAHVALASSLVAYPPITTKSTSPSAVKGADAALQYLRCVRNTIEGPAYKVIRKAFAFPEDRTRRRAPARNGNDSANPSPGAGDIEHLAVKPASAQSIWYLADDFWHIVGWALNCSVAHKKRWTRWKLWLDVMLDFLEADWDTCIKEAKEEEVNREDVLQASLIWRYISSENPTSRSTRRRIAAAILATADKTARRNYVEIWKNETADPKPRDTNINPTAKLDFESGQLGDYNDDEDTATLDAPRSAAAREASVESDDSSIATSANAVDKLGGRDAVQLRQRLFALLTRVAYELPSQFTTPEDFCDNFTEQLKVKDMPISIFSVILSTSQLSNNVQLALHGNMLLLLVAPKVPNYFHRLPIQRDFEADLLHLRASSQSFADNAKISLILEQMFLYMISETLLEATGKLRTALESGIEARQTVFGTGKGKKHSAEEEEQGKEIMEATSERLLGLMELLEMAAGKGPRPRKEKNTSNPLSALLSFGSSLSSAPESEGNDDY
ncbi:hypothetical protein P280DRAFT_277826 [Massarina eburnea CBS 473.64]|uniref:Uncharacterized protein n=1 Tax=Massarina eburnea CBS 473.64 TaxID=1395130 RepID=A0A6A6S6K6_9PLEO|nr:hypothetical protein P280DRAFT_277826 [Massarina eburnea CBS 473.64]